jgi:hypothetical protein
MNFSGKLHDFCAKVSGGDGAVFCSSLVALQKAYDAGLERDVEILTRAPALLASGNPSVQNLDERSNVSRADLGRFGESTNDVLERCLGSLTADESTRQFARIALRAVWIFQMRAICSAFLCERDAHQPRLILDVALEEQGRAIFLQYPWGKLLAQNPNAASFEVDVPVPEHLRQRSQTEPRLRRLQVRGAGHFYRRLYEVLGRGLPDAMFRGDYVSVNGTELESDIAVALASRLFKLHQFKLPTLESSSLSEAIAPLSEAIATDIWKIYSVHLARVAPSFVLETLRKDLVVRIDEQIKLYERTRKVLQSSDWVGQRDRPILFTTNYPQNSAFLALTDTLNERGIPLIGVQHGITRELVENPQNTVNYENVVAPYLFCLTQRGVEISGKSAFRRPDSKVEYAGLPQAFRRLRKTCDRRGSLGRARTVLYAQPHTRVGGVFAGATYRDDQEASDHELRMFRDVLATLPHSVVVKPYPETAYLDEDPAIAEARTHPNISIDETGWDMRFLLQESWLVVTVGATSTLSWIYWSGRPFVYVDPPCSNLRLKTELVPVFRETMSYFDQSDPDYLMALKAWLARPKDEIVAEWAHNRERRQEYLNDVFGDSQDRPLCDLISNHVKLDSRGLSA